MAEVRRHKTEPLESLRVAKELRRKCFEDYLKAKERGGIRVSGSAAMLYAVPMGLGEDVYILPGEPYGARVSALTDFSLKCMEAVEREGFSRELCAYMRNYWGSLLLNKFILPDGTIIDGWPKADIYWTPHYCCEHAGWYRNAAEMGGDGTLFGLDMNIGFKEERLYYPAQQILELIEGMEKVTGREYKDELFIEAAKNECQSNSLWGEICAYQKNIPAPLDELTLFSLYIVAIHSPHRKETVDFLLHLRDEIEDRVKRGITTLPIERYRIMLTEPQPPWPYVYQIWRYLERKYYAIPIGSLHSFFLGGSLIEDGEGNVVPQKFFEEKWEGVADREKAIYNYLKFKLYWTEVYLLRSGSLARRFSFNKKIFKQWHADFVFIHLNSGCEATCLSQPELRSALMEEGIPVLSFEGSMADYREINVRRIINQIDTLFEGLGVRKR